MIRGSYTRWTPELVATLTALWLDGATMTEIAEQMHLPSRNTVAGQIQRLGLNNVDRPGRARRGRRADPDRVARWGKTDESGQRRFVTAKRVAGGRVRLRDDNPAVVEGRTTHPTRRRDPAAVLRVLKSGHNSRKIGKVVTKGRWRGFPLFTLTLEERATCPRTCLEWASCYGTNMPYAQRILAGTRLEGALWGELEQLQGLHPAGFVVRLHILGDFYSLDYVDLWAAALDSFPALRVFGYTARLPGTPIGDALLGLARTAWDRFAIRFSGADLPQMSSLVVSLPQDARSVVCPAQTGGTDCCATCALCWHSQQNITFLRH